jgi:hypothetical protein
MLWLLKEAAGVFPQSLHSHCSRSVFEYATTSLFLILICSPFIALASFLIPCNLCSYNIVVNCPEIRLGSNINLRKLDEVSSYRSTFYLFNYLFMYFSHKYTTFQNRNANIKLINSLVLKTWMHSGSTDTSHVTDRGLISGLPTVDVLWTRLRMRRMFGGTMFLCRSFHLSAHCSVFTIIIY